MRFYDVLKFGEKFYRNIFFPCYLISWKFSHPNWWFIQHHFVFSSFSTFSNYSLQQNFFIFSFFPVSPMAFYWRDNLTENLPPLSLPLERRSPVLNKKIYNRLHIILNQRPFIVRANLYSLCVMRDEERENYVVEKTIADYLINCLIKFNLMRLTGSIFKLQCCKAINYNFMKPLDVTCALYCL